MLHTKSEFCDVPEKKSILRICLTQKCTLKVCCRQISPNNFLPTKMALKRRHVEQEDSFLVAFPTEGELQRMSDIGYQLKNHDIMLNISSWHSAIDAPPTYQLEEVWVHINGCLMHGDTT